MKKHITIIGAGPGGLASAMLLSARGFRVTLFESQPWLGGRTAEIEVGDYRFDLGPTFLMMKYLMDELFREAGFESSDFLDCRRLDPMYRLYFHNKSLLVHDNKEKMKAEVERVFPGEGAGMERFMRRESHRFEKLYPCLQREYGSLRQLVSRDLIAAVPHIALGRSLYDVLSDYFKSEELRLAFTFQSKYLGMSPWDCPGLFAMIPYTEHAHGIYHVMGGLSQIPRALAKAAIKNGTEIRLSTPVRKVIVEKGAARGVELQGGERVYSDEVVINADFGYAMTRLFDPGVIKKYTPEKLRDTKYSCSTFMIYLGLDKMYDCEHHSITFAKNYKNYITDISKGLFTEETSIYIRNSSPMDASAAPPGHSALYILAPVSNNLTGIDWNKNKATYRNKILDFLELSTPYKGLREHIREEMIFTPDDWEKKSNVYMGATFNMSHNWRQLMYYRPHNKFEEVDHCYLVGGGTHPGSGLPTIFESARISSHLICDHYEVAYERPNAFKDLVF